MRKTDPKMLRFVDLFSGCGGLSLGLSLSGAQGLFAIEKDSMAFETFKSNFIDYPTGAFAPFAWPDWLEKRAWGIDDFLLNPAHARYIELLAGGIDLISGGPPCQGFSFAGKRNADDPRNQLFLRYIEAVRRLKPRAVLLENVPGMAVAHGVSKGDAVRKRNDSTGSFYEVLAQELAKLGYDVDKRLVDASEYGVPQRRIRLIVIGVRREAGYPEGNMATDVLENLKASRESFLRKHNLIAPVSAEEAIGDLSVFGRDMREWPLQPSFDSPDRFMELIYDGRRSRSAYQRLMREGAPAGYVDSMRLANHSYAVRDRFRKIINLCRQGVRMNEEDRARFNLKKHRIHPMSAYDPAPTITTLPDDVLHFRDPRILTVRETARLQSFPDYFVFKGKYTTGGNLRTRECPRYTQVGNAVPPLLAKAIGQALHQVLRQQTKPTMPRAADASPRFEEACA
jgi:DNA (cytosine-5)-methyltransferase 1